MRLPMAFLVAAYWHDRVAEDGGIERIRAVNVVVGAPEHPYQPGVPLLERDHVVVIELKVLVHRFEDGAIDAARTKRVVVLWFPPKYACTKFAITNSKGRPSASPAPAARSAVWKSSSACASSTACFASSHCCAAAASSTRA